MTALDQPRSAVLDTPAAAPREAAAHFAARLSYETDPADLRADQEAGIGGFLIVDVRSADAFVERHIPGAVSLPHRTITRETTAHLDPARTLVTYCWGPGCNGSTRGALALARLGFHVKELIGGIEYWRREGYPLAEG